MQPRPPVPSTPIGRFRLVEEIGRGGMGVVYRAIDPNTGDHVALKVLLAGQHGNEEAVARFLREAEAAAALRHAHLVPVREQGWDADKPFLVMDLVEGPSLEAAIAADGALPPRRAAEVASGLARGLHCAHRTGLVHRDVKPGNILLEGGEQARLTDFGLAIDREAQRLTRTGQVLGTPTYMAPEQATSQRDVPGELSDQYSLGAVLYEMLTGHPPYEGATAAQVLVTLVGQPPRPLRSLAPAIPMDLVTVVETAMARDPENRYPDCAALADDLDRFLRGQHVVAKPRPLWERASEHVVRHRMAWTAVVLGVGIVVGGGLGYSMVTQMRASRAEVAREVDAAAAYRALELPSTADERQPVLRQWLADEAHRGTHAATQARLDEAERLLDTHSADAASWFGDAFAAARRADHQQRALEGVVDAFEWSWRFDDMVVVADSLQTAFPSTPRSTVAARVAAADADFVAAAAALAEPHPPGSTLFAAQAAARPAVDVPVGVRAVNWDGDASDGLEVAAAVDGRLRVVRLSSGGPVVDRWVELPDDVNSVKLLATVPPTLLGHREGEGQGELLLLDAEGRPLLVVPDAAPLDALATDLDGDGQAEVYAGIGPYTRHLRRFSVDDDGSWTSDEGPASLIAAASDVTALLRRSPAGRPPELWVASGAWRAYDLRTFVADPEGQLEQVHRQKQGYVSQMVDVGGRVALVDSDLYPSRVGFAAGQEYGAERGIWLMDPTSGSVEHLPVPGPPQTELGPLHPGDFDGDGDLDLALGLRHGDDRAMAMWAGEGATFDGPWLVRDLLPAAAAQLDDDDALELVVQLDATGTTWVLGDGDATVPRRREPTPRHTHALPPGVQQRLAERWSRAEDLAAMGLHGEGADHLLALATTLPPDEVTVRAAAWARAGELRARAGDTEAGATWMARGAELDPRHVAEATQALLDAHRVDEAVAFGAPAPRWLHEARRIDLLDDAAMPWGSPLFVRRQTDGVAWSAVAGGPRLGQRTFDWAGHHLSLELEATLERMEWGSGIEVRIVPTEGEPIHLGARGWGGGQHLEREVGCFEPAAPHPRHTVDAADTVEAWRWRVDWRDGQLYCSLTDHRGRSTTSVRPWLLSPGAVTVEVWPADHAGVRTNTLTSVSVRRFEVAGAGLVPVDTPTPPDARAALWAAADGEPDVATLGTLARRHPDEVPRLLRLRTPTVTPPLAEVLGHGALLPFARAFDTAFHNHPDDPTTLRAHTVAAGAVLAVDLTGAGYDERLAAATIRARRGSAWRRLGEPDAARRDLRVAAEAIRGLRDEAPDRRDALPVGFLVHTELAALAAEAGDDGGARAAMAEAIRWHASPDIARDLLAVRPELTPLVTP